MSPDTLALLVSSLCSSFYRKRALEAGEERKEQETFISSVLPSKNFVLGNSILAKDLNSWFNGCNIRRQK